MSHFDLSLKEVSYLVALLEADRQTALQLLAADHFYEPSLLPRLKKFQQQLKVSQLAKQESIEQTNLTCFPLMALSKAAEEAFHAAIEAAYAMQEPGVSVEDRKLAEKAYVHHMQQYYWFSGAGSRDDWWEKECSLAPDSQRCKLYDV